MDTVYLAQFCLKAADLISGRGLAKGKLVDEDTGAICNNGAILIALGLPEDNLEGRDWKTWPQAAFEGIVAIKLAEQVILDSIGAPTRIPWEYNDLESTSAEDTILLLKLTAEKIRSMDIDVNIPYLILDSSIA